MLDIQTHQNLQQQVMDIYTNAGEWRSFDMWEVHAPTINSLQDKIAFQLQQKFIESFRIQHECEDGLNQYEMILLRVPKGQTEQIQNRIHNAMRNLNKMGESQAQDPSVQRLKKYAEGMKYLWHDRNGDDLTGLETYTMTDGRDDGDHEYIGVFAHPQVRRVVAASIIQNTADNRYKG
jgi:hypothetical protein